MRKVASLVLVVTFMAVAAAPAAAYHWPEPQPEPTKLVVNSSAIVRNDVDTVANTGWNSVDGTSHYRRYVPAKGTILTGDALAVGNVYNMVNTNSVGCDCYDDITLNSRAWVSNYVDTTANTGWNSVHRGGFVRSGDATARSLVEGVINTNVVGGIAD